MPSWVERKCAEKGLRMTDQRRVIAKVLSDADDHPDAEELYSRAAAVDPKISLATVKLKYKSDANKVSLQ